MTPKRVDNTVFKIIHIYFSKILRKLRVGRGNV